MIRTTLLPQPEVLVVAEAAVEVAAEAEVSDLSARSRKSQPRVSENIRVKGF